MSESDEAIASKLGEALEKNKYSKAQSYIDELIRRNPFNKELYQFRMTINRKLNKNDLILKDIQKMQNFIPGVSLDELININETDI
jgi:predicted Zn-dependent protease